MSTTITLNGLSVVSAKLSTPHRGVWSAELDLDPAVSVAPSGPAVLKIGTTILNGTIHPESTGVFAKKVHARVLGGGGGWHKPVPAQHFYSPAGVSSVSVLSATAALVGERIVQAVPSILGKHYTRDKGPASRVLDGLEWYVDPTSGTTVVGPRLPRAANPVSLEVLEWDPLEQRATIATDDVVTPGTTIVDARFGTAYVRDVEQTFGADGNRARCEAWCGKATDEGARLVSLLASVARETIRDRYANTHTYRVVVPSGGGYALQAIVPGGPMPDMLPIETCFGIPGTTASLSPGTEVLVAFADGNPSKPLIVGFVDGSPMPLEMTIRSLMLTLGDPTATGVATMQSMTPLFSAISLFFTAAQTFFNFPLIAALSGGTAQPVAGAAATVIGLLAAFPANFSQRVKAA